jgi:glyoxylase-like metal-dependent hydrolase (beta-lactamase superfamily II)
MGPASGVEPVLTQLAPGVWVTCGRAVALEGPDHLAVIDPGDEPGGPLGDVRSLLRETGKPLRWILVTHAHPDHVANLASFRQLGPATVIAHRSSPLGPDLAVAEPTRLDVGGGLEAIPTPGHSAWGDDLTFWLPARRIVFPGDLVQPKGERWEHTFYPSPWAFFRNGDLYRESLGRIAALPFDTLVTGHREIRRGAEGRHWVELAIRCIERVREAVVAWDGDDDLRVAGPAIYRQIARERGIPDELIAARLAADPGGTSAFGSYDLPGIEYYWERVRRKALLG